VNRTRALLLATAVPLLIVLGVLVSAALHSGRGGGGGAVGHGAAAFDPAGAQRTDVGSGAQAAAIFRPGDASGPGPVVVLIHAWAAIDPASYGPWIDHLVGEGVTVVYPTYRERVAARRTQPLADTIAALRAAFADIQVAPGRLVLAGDGAGGALAADYAASARAGGLPSPAAVLSVYPDRTAHGAGGHIAEVDARRIPAGTRLLVLAGARGTLAGDRVARRIVRTATRARATLRPVGDPAAGDDAAPRRAGAAERRAFWAPLDRLVAGTASAAGQG
jgi:acetyl esterase/lipase